MDCAILKFSYREIGKRPVGGICGSAFFVGGRLALTANHVLSTTNFKPNAGYNFCQYWLVSRAGGVIPLNTDMLKDYPESDSTGIVLSPSISPAETPHRLAGADPGEGELVHCFAHDAHVKPVVHAGWTTDGLVVHSCDLQPVQVDLTGVIRWCGHLDAHANGVHLADAPMLDPGFHAVRSGAFGAAVRRVSSGEVVGLMSFGLPTDQPVKQEVFAVRVSRVRQVVKWIAEQRAKEIFMRRGHGGDPFGDWLDAKRELGISDDSI